MMGFRVMNEEAVGQAYEENLACEVCDEMLEAAAGNEEIHAWTTICTGIQCPG
jgi:hypothetical protein